MASAARLAFLAPFLDAMAQQKYPAAADLFILSLVGEWQEANGHFRLTGKAKRYLRQEILSALMVKVERWQDLSKLMNNEKLSEEEAKLLKLALRDLHQLTFLQLKEIFTGWRIAIERLD